MNDVDRPGDLLTISGDASDYADVSAAAQACLAEFGAAGRRGGQLADTIVWALTQPPGVDVYTLTVRPVGAPIA